MTSKNFEKGNTISFKRIKTIILLLIYIALLALLYQYHVLSIFRGYESYSLSLQRLFLSVTLLSIALTIFPSNWKAPSDAYLSLLIALIIIPMGIIYPFSRFDPLYMLTVGIGLISISIIIKTKSINIPRLHVTPKFLTSILYFTSLTTLAWMLYTTNLDFVTGIRDVYETRLENRELLYPGLWGYIIPWTAKTVIPALTTMALYKRRFSEAFLIVILQISFFSLTSHKLYIVLAFVPFAAYLFLSAKNNAQAILSWAIIFLFLLFLAIEITDNIWLKALGVQRPLFKPSLLNFLYVDFFLNKEKTFLTHSIFSMLSDYPYRENPSFLIGNYLKDSENTRSNTGFMGSSFAHFGYLGVILASFVVGLMLKLLDDVSRNLPIWVTISITFGAFSSLLMSSDLLPALLTQGTLFSLLLLWLAPQGSLGISSEYRRGR